MASQWLPGATRVLGESSGSSSGGGAKILHHTTEGSSATGAISSYRSTRSWPTITAEWTGSRLKVFQHMRLDQMARALEHPAGTPPTNTANVVQIEHVGFTDDAWRRKVGGAASLLVANWPIERWHAIAELCREIEAVTGCPRVSAVPAAWWPSPQRLSGSEFVKARGHLGHVHAANNHHTDGTGMRIGLILGDAGDSKAFRTLTNGMTGPDVLALQKAVRLRASRCGRPDHMPEADGIMGPQTLDDAAFAAFILGIGEHQSDLIDGGLSVMTQQRIRNPKLRNRTQLKRAAERRKLHCKGA
jgi:hypothetical protein